MVAERNEPGISFVRSPNDQRSQLVAALGFTIPPEIGQLSGDQDGATISDEQMGLLDRDVLLWNTGYTPEVRPEIEAAPLYSQLAVVRAGRSLFVEDPQVSAAWTWGTVLSLPSVIDAIVAAARRGGHLRRGRIWRAKVAPVTVAGRAAGRPGSISRPTVQECLIS